MDHCHAERSEASRTPSDRPFAEFTLSVANGLRVTTWGKDFLHRKVTDSGTFGYTIEDLYHILFSVLSLLTLR